MRKFVVLAMATLFVATTAGPAPAKPWPRWVRPAGKQVVVQFERTRVSNTMWAELKVAMRAWSRSGRVEAVPVARCRNPRLYCVKVIEYRARDRRGGHTRLFADPRTNRAWYGDLRVNNYYATSKAARRKIACHEVGHALGAVHRGRGRSCMRDGLSTLHTTPGSADYAYLQRIYRLPG